MSDGLRDAMSRKTFVDDLLRVISGSVEAAGANEQQRSVRQKLSNQSTIRPDEERFASRVADARFMLGADDGAYLRTNVMPLQTVEVNCDDNPLSTVQPDIDRFGQLGVLNAVYDHVIEKRLQSENGLSEGLSVCAWLMTIEEVSTFVNAHLADLASSGILSKTLEEAYRLAQAFDSQSVDLTKSTQDLLVSGNRAAACELLKIVLALFDRPMETVLEQLDTTIGTGDMTTKGTGTNKLRDGLDRLALSARFVNATKQADEFRNTPLVLIKVHARAVAINALVTGIVDETVVDFPVGWDDSDEQLDATNTLLDSHLHTAHKLRKRTLIQAAADFFDVETFRKETSDTQTLMRSLTKRAADAKSTAEQLRKALEDYENLHDDPTPEQERSMSRDKANIKLNDAINVVVMAEVDVLEATQRLKNETDFKGTKTSEEWREEIDAMEEVLRELESRDPLTDVVRRKLQRMQSRTNLFKAKENVAWSEEKLQELIEDVETIIGTNGRPPILGSPEFQEYKRLRDLLGKLPEGYSIVLRVGDVLPYKEPGPSSVEVNTARGALERANENFQNVLQQEIADLEGIVATRKDEFAKAALDYETTIAQLADEADNERQKKAREAKVAEAQRREDERKRKEAAEAAAAAAEEEEALRKAKEEELLEIEAKRKEQSDLYCKPPDRSLVANDDDVVIDGLCAGISQLRGDGGAAFSEDGFYVRRNGISPFFPRVKYQATRSTEIDDWWAKTLWPSSSSTIDDNAIVGLRERINDLGDVRITEDGSIGGLKLTITYCLARGLCAFRAPHHEVPRDATTLLYSLPRSGFPTFDVNIAGFKGPGIVQKTIGRLAFGNAKINPRFDFVARPISGKPQRDDASFVKWAPVSEGWSESGTGSLYGATRIIPNLEAHNAVATSVVFECMVDDYKAQFEDKSVGTTSSDRLLARACAAAAKILQLDSMAKVFSQEDLRTLCIPNPKNSKTDETHYFVTRPVIRCPGPMSRVLYPCDAGLANYSKVKTPVPQKEIDEAQDSPLQFGQAYGRVIDDDQLSGKIRATQERDKMSWKMRSAIADPRLTEEEEMRTSVPLYIAPPPGVDESVEWPPETSNPATRDVNPKLLPMLKPDRANPLALGSVLINGLKQCQNLEQLDYELAAIERAKKDIREGKSNPDPDRAARLRRAAVWNDAMREACISGDRLWAFVRQLSGTISESVDAVCQIDEGMLVRQQQQARERGARLSDRAAQEHMQLVRNVFSSVIKESGLTLGIEQNGNIGSLKVVSNALRKQASELAGGSSAGEGFFSNSVRLENLLSKGTGEMTLERLFHELQDAGRALQETAESSYTTPSASTSLDFLSAPRNSLLLRYKPEALAAIRQAFDIFQREMMSQHGRMYRTITAYELIEGNDETLCSAFAQLSAHMLVHSRMYSSATAMYVAAWPAAANAQQLKISLQRLVHVGCRYLSATAAPNFLSDSGREQYFGQQVAIGLPVAPSRRLYPNGQWGMDMYGLR